jgi:hypothetical protein
VQFYSFKICPAFLQIPFHHHNSPHPFTFNQQPNMSPKTRTVVTNVCLKTAKRASTFMHSRFGAHIYNDGHIPLLASSHRALIDEEDERDLDMTYWEYQAALERPHQERLWDAEIEEREQKFASTRLMHTSSMSARQARRSCPIICADRDFRRVQIQPPAANVARYELPSLHSAKLSTASYATETATYEQQTDIIRETDGPEEVGLEKWETSDVSTTSSLRRRGALKRKANPLFARPTCEDFERRPVAC